MPEGMVSSACASSKISLPSYIYDEVIDHLLDMPIVQSAEPRFIT